MKKELEILLTIVKILEDNTLKSIYNKEKKT